MPPVQRRVVNRLIRSACTEISQEILNELESKKKRKWVKAWVARRGKFGASDNLLRELAIEDPAGYMNVLRMDKTKCEELLVLIAPAIKKQDTVMRSSISGWSKVDSVAGQIIFCT